MRNPKLEELKQWLKDHAPTIRSTKQEHKEAQRAGKSSWKLQSKVLGLKYEYRHRHIAYSQLRGRKREQIECPRDNNLPNETYITALMGEYRCETLPIN